MNFPLAGAPRGGVQLLLRQRGGFRPEARRQKRRPTHTWPELHPICWCWARARALRAGRSSFLPEQRTRSARRSSLPAAPYRRSPSGVSRIAPALPGAPSAARAARACLAHRSSLPDAPTDADAAGLFRHRSCTRRRALADARPARCRPLSDRPPDASAMWHSDAVMLE